MSKIEVVEPNDPRIAGLKPTHWIPVTRVFTGRGLKCDDETALEYVKDLRRSKESLAEYLFDRMRQTHEFRTSGKYADDVNDECAAEWIEHNVRAQVELALEAYRDWVAGKSA
jgi:hypothetical protein